MSAAYRKIYASGNLVAYGKADGGMDHLFLWEGTSAPDTFSSLPELVKAWKPAQRTLLFCPNFDPATLKAALDRLVSSPNLPICWGKFAYWMESPFSGRHAPFALFPTENVTVQVSIADVSLGLDVGTPPRSLDDFTIGCDSSGMNLTLSLAGSPNALWSIDGAHAGNLLFVRLAASAGFVAGAVGIAANWPSSEAPHPLRRTGFLFMAAPVDPLQPGGGAVPCRIWKSQLSDTVLGKSATCAVFLDPRDNTTKPGWLRGEMNSHLLFGDAEIHSNFLNPKGGRFILQAEGGAARLGLVYDLLMADDNNLPSLVSSGDQALFHPEGDFRIRGPVPVPNPALNISERDFLCGAAATEFFDLSPATHVRFVKRQPAFFLSDEKEDPPWRLLLDDFGGLAVTSHVQFVGTGGTAIGVEYHSQPVEAPLFADEGGDHLRRRRVSYGAVAIAAPVFPWAGLKQIDPAMRGFELTHLSQYRRNKAVRRAPANAMRLLGASSGELAATTSTSTSLAITPQGLLAEVTTDGRYSRLYFGNPDSEATRVDFSLRICNTQNDRYNDVQQALAANQLFMVFNNTNTDVLRTISPSATLYARQFEFSVGPEGIDTAEPCAAPGKPLRSSVVIIKYFNGKSLKELIEDTRLWACQAALAPQGNKGIKELANVDDPVPAGAKDYLKDLREKWNDPAWQGILVLDLPVPVMPDILEALRPGLSPSIGQLRAHHFGLNIVPARKSDLAAGSIPRRSGSAFGLIRYDRRNNPEPNTATSADKEPGAASDPRRTYKFVVDSVHVAFENSQISTFDAKVFLKFDTLFWDSVAPDNAEHGSDGLKSIELDGYYESRSGRDGARQDIFSLVTPAQMAVDFSTTSFLKRFTITRAQLSVTSVDRAAGNHTLTARIDIDGTLTLNEKLTKLPLFSVKTIRLSTFGFRFVYDYGDAQHSSSLSFGFDAPRMSADIDFTPGDTPSFLSSLPLKIKGMSVALSDLLDLGQLNFLPFNFSGLDPDGAMGTKFHFGFLMDLDLGSIGKLAGDLNGFHVPLLLGWRGGSTPGFALGIQFPTLNGKIDIGIQQFIRLRAEKLNIERCLDSENLLIAIAIQAVGVRVAFLGKEWPVEDNIAFAIFVTPASGRKPSWVFGYETGDGTWYVGGGYRIILDSSTAKDTKGLVKHFHDTLRGIGENTSVCTLLGAGREDNDNWSIAARYQGAFNAAIAVSDPGIYGLALDIHDLGELDLLYRRVNGELGIFSVEFSLPGPMRTMQFGAATIRLPILRVEVHTDGGFLADFGFPWNNNFARSAQVEIAIFLGSGGFYYGLTAASASDLLSFAGGYGFTSPDPLVLNRIRTLRLGFAARVGLGRSFTIGILSAEASITLFGGIEGAAGYRPDEKDLLHPTVYALRGYVGLMLDISATVSFAIIQASARILAYADVGLEIRRVLVRQGTTHYLVTLPVVIFANIGLTVGVDVGIHVGCVDITIHLSFSATWHFQQTLGSLSTPELYDGSLHAAPLFVLDNLALASSFAWPVDYQYWGTSRTLNIYVTVLPCKAQPSDFGETGDAKTCVVGTMMLQVLPKENAFADLARFLTGWLLLKSPAGNPSDYDPQPVTLGTLRSFQDSMKEKSFWDGFPDAVLTVTKKQFAPAFKNAQGDDLFAVLPPWPGSSFRYVPEGAPAVVGTPAQVNEGEKPMNGADAAFVEYCRYLIVGTISEIALLVQTAPGESREDVSKSLKWSDVWDQMFANI